MGGAAAASARGISLRLPLLPTGQAGDLRGRANALLEAIRLTELGARASLVCQLTGLEKAVANRLYRQLHGRSSPPGLLPFTDAWYLRNPQRMLQASVVWCLGQRFARLELSPAGCLIAVDEAYRWLIATPVLDITRVAFVPQLVAIQEWQEQRCQLCHTRYVTPAGSPDGLCWGCRRHMQRTCRMCGASLPGHADGRGRGVCGTCRRSRVAASHRWPV
jgi:hypothetical protein